MNDEYVRRTSGKCWQILLGRQTAPVRCGSDLLKQSAKLTIDGIKRPIAAHLSDGLVSIVFM